MKYLKYFFHLLWNCLTYPFMLLLFLPLGVAAWLILAMLDHYKAWENRQ